MRYPRKYKKPTVVRLANGPGTAWGDNGCSPGSIATGATCDNSGDSATTTCTHYGGNVAGCMAGDGASF